MKSSVYAIKYLLWRLKLHLSDRVNALTMGSYAIPFMGHLCEYFVLTTIHFFPLKTTLRKWLSLLTPFTKTKHLAATVVQCNELLMQTDFVLATPSISSEKFRPTTLLFLETICHRIWMIKHLGLKFNCFNSGRNEIFMANQRNAHYVKTTRSRIICHCK